MAAPSPTARGTPDGIPLKDGFSTLLTIYSDLTIEFWEKTVKPPGIDGGDAIDGTTMHNTTWRVQRPRSLKSLTPLSLTAVYDPQVYASVLARINDEDTMTITFPDGSTLAFFGFVRNMEMDSNEEGSQPTFTMEVIPTNWDPTNNVEAGPVLTSVAGT